MKTICIFAPGNICSVGGIQTYLKNLEELFSANGYRVIFLINRAPQSIAQEVYGREVISTPPNSSKSNQTFFTECRKKIGSDAIYIIGSDQYGVRCRAKGVIAIQHGIAFDDPMTYCSGWQKPLGVRWFIKIGRIYRNIRRAYSASAIVCVDYNFYNWLRAVAYISSRQHIKIIPNFTATPFVKEEIEKKLQNSTRRKIIFARRFVEPRGTLLFMRVAQKLLAEYPNLEITFAGSGPLEATLQQTFAKEQNIKIFSFSSEESLKVHFGYDICVVPTVFSEGTSLSLCEAMAAGCYPVATCVGGLSNILIDQYNGSLVLPNENAFLQELKKVLDLPQQEFRARTLRAWETVQYGFSKHLWSQKWLDFIRTNDAM